MNDNGKITIRVGCDEHGMGGREFAAASHGEVGRLSVQWGWHREYEGRVRVVWKGTGYHLDRYLIATGQGAILGRHWAELSRDAEIEKEVD